MILDFIKNKDSLFNTYPILLIIFKIYEINNVSLCSKIQ